VFAGTFDLGFEASGELELWKDSVTNYTILSKRHPATNSMLQETGRFEVSVKGNLWRLITILTNGQEMIQGCDGRDVYWLMVERKNNQSMCAGRVTEGVYPLHSTTSFSSVPWIAYCSSDFFAKWS